MKIPVIFLMLLMAAFPGWNPTMSTSESGPLGGQYISNELIVCFRENVPVPEKNLFDGEIRLTANAVLTQLSAERRLIAVERLIPEDLPRPTEGLTVERLPRFAGRPPTREEIAAIFHHFGQDRTFVLRFSHPIDPVRMAEQLMRDYSDLIEYAEPNVVLHVGREPNDPRFRFQWHLLTRTSNPDRRADVRAPEAWDMTTGSPNVVIAVIDTGAAFNHRDMVDKFLAGRSFVSGVSSPTDDNGHGTAVSGTAAANTDNALDVAGICWTCRILPVKVISRDGTGSLSAVTRGINYAISQASQGVRVINLSLGYCGTASFTLRNALQAAGTAGILVTAAAGNGCGNDGNGKNNDEQPDYPANFAAELENVVSVASTGRFNQLSSFSNYGRTTVTLAAPGEGIFTTVPTDTSLEISSSSGVAPISGTSFAAPIVAGIAGLIFSQFPGATIAQARARLAGSVDRFTEFLDKLAAGGRVNAFRALEQDQVAPDPITDLQVQVGSSPPTLTWTATGDDGQEGQAMFYEIRYSPNEITAENFNQAFKVPIAPFPQVAGATESWSIRNVPPGTFFFAIRAIDNVGNSSISNVVMVQVN